MTNIDDTNLKTFALFIQNVENGALHDDLTEKMQEVLHELMHVGMTVGGKQSAQMNIALNLTLDDNLVEIKTAIKTKVPEIPRKKSMYFVNEDARLTRQNPRQRSFDELTEVRNQRKG